MCARGAPLGGGGGGGGGSARLGGSALAAAAVEAAAPASLNLSTGRRCLAPSQTGGGELCLSASCSDQQTRVSGRSEPVWLVWHGCRQSLHPAMFYRVQTTEKPFRVGFYGPEVWRDGLLVFAELVCQDLVLVSSLVQANECRNYLLDKKH